MAGDAHGHGHAAPAAADGAKGFSFYFNSSSTFGRRNVRFEICSEL